MGDVYVLDCASKSLLRDEMQELHLSAWAHRRLLKLARTIAQLAGVDGVERAHLVEAIQCRLRRQV